MNDNQLSIKLTYPIKIRYSLFTRFITLLLTFMLILMPYSLIKSSINDMNEFNRLYYIIGIVFAIIIFIFLIQLCIAQLLDLGLILEKDGIVGHEGFFYRKFKIPYDTITNIKTYFVGQSTEDVTMSVRVIHVETTTEKKPIKMHVSNYKQCDNIILFNELMKHFPDMIKKNPFRSKEDDNFGNWDDED